MMSIVSTVSTMSTRVSRHCYQASTNQLLNHYDVYNIYSLYSLYKDFQGLLMISDHTLYVPIHEVLLSEDRDQTECINGISPTNRWTIRKVKSMARTISTTYMQSATRQLGRCLTYGSICSQLVAKCHNKGNPILTNHGMDAQNHLDQFTIHSTISQSKNGRINDQTTAHTRLYQTHAATDGTKRKLKVYTLSSRRNSLARRGKLANPLPYVQISTKAIWTIPHQKGLIRSDVRIRTTPTVEDPPSIPHQPPNTI